MRFLLALVFSAALGFGQECAPARALPEGTIAGALDDSSCQLTDATAYASYRLDLPARGQIEIALSTTQDFVLILRDGTGAQVDSGAAIRRPVDAGTYTLLVNARVPGQVGDYSVKTSFTVEPGTLCNVFPSLGLNQATKGNLGASGCTLPDGTPYEAYWLNTMGAGTLTVTVSAVGFTPSVTVRTPDGAAAASASNTVTAPVDRQSRYEIVVSTADQVGAFDIATSFQPDPSETCASLKTLSASGKDAASITGDSCAAMIPGSGDIQYFNFYTIQVDAAGVADIAVTSTDFLPTLYLFDEGGNTVAADAGGAVNGSELQMMLRPGAYMLQVLSSIPSGGAYQLTYQLAPGTPRPCAPAMLNASGGQTGALAAAASCRSQFGASDLYTLSLASAGTVDLTLTADLSLTGVVAIRDAKDNLILTTDDIEGLGIVRLSADLPAGTYTVVVAAEEGNGGYQLTSRFSAHDLAPCSYAQPVDSNGGYVKRLSSFSCRGANGAPMDLFEFTMAADGTAVMVVTSSEMDGYLTLLDAAGNVLRQDDNSYGFADPMIVQYLAAGTYRLAVRSASGSGGGLYEVDVRTALGPRPVFCGVRQAIAIGGSASGSLAFTGCPYDGAFADIYRFDVADSGTVDVQLASNDFDAYLVLLDAKGNVVGSDDDSGGGANARITMTLAPGSYYAVATASTDYTAAGSYTLSVH